MTISRLTEKNNYSGYTWHIKISSLFHIYINSTPENTFVVDFKEWKWLSYKTRFSFVSKNDLSETIKEAFEKTQDFFNNSSEVIWTENQKNESLKEILNFLKDSYDEITLSFLKPILKTPKKSVEIIAGLGIDENILNLSNSRMIIQKYGNPDNLINHNEHSIEMQYSEIGLSFYYKKSDQLQIIFIMSVNQNSLAETETGMKFHEKLTLGEVIENYGSGNFTTPENDDSEYAKMTLEGIIFEMKISELTNNEPKKAIIRKIMVY